MYFFSMIRDGKSIEIVYLPGDKELYASTVMSLRSSKHDYEVAFEEGLSSSPGRETIPMDELVRILTTYEDIE